METQGQQLLHALAQSMIPSLCTHACHLAGAALAVFVFVLGLYVRAALRARR